MREEARAQLIKYQLLPVGISHFLASPFIVIVHIIIIIIIILNYENNRASSFIVIRYCFVLFQIHTGQTNRHRLHGFNASLMASSITFDTYLYNVEHCHIITSLWCLAVDFIVTAELLPFMLNCGATANH